MQSVVIPNVVMLSAVGPKNILWTGTNTVAYYAGVKVTREEKGFIRWPPVANVIKLFTAVIYDFS